MIRSAFLVILLSLLVGCSGMKPTLPADLQGKNLVVVKPVSFAPEAFSALFQAGLPITQRDLSIWNYHCEFRLKESRRKRWYLEEGSYELAGLKLYTRLCDWDGCDLVNEFSLNTLSGPEALRMTCARRALYADPGNYLLLPLTPDQLEIILGDALQVR